MDTVVYLVAYAGVAVFLIAVIARAVAYMKHPMHVRWELYPVAHEEGERAKYGGSYLEDVDWWKKPRHSSKVGELKVMIPEILLLKGVWESNKPLWYVSFPFHFGLYVLAGFVGLLGIGAICHLAEVPVFSGSPSGFGNLLAVVTKIVGPVGLALTGIGAIGLLLRRLTSEDLRTYSSPGHFFNLFLFIAVVGLAFYTWRSVDPDFIGSRVFLASLLTFKFQPIGNTLFSVTAIVCFAVIAYIPLTHMSHFFMKYFLWHDIRWGDEPNTGKGTKYDRAIGEVLGYKVSWAAAHVASEGGTKTWAEVATHNPARDPEKEGDKS